MDSTWQTRTKGVLGENGIEKLKNSCVAVVGLGGVGSFAFEALVRAGVGKLIIIDHDVVDVSNINRQLVATKKTVGKPKVEIAKEHALEKNDEVRIIAIKEFISSENAKELLGENVDIIIDAIDSVNSKVELVEFASANNIEIISSMGTANKLDPLAKIMRKKLKDKGVQKLKVIYSTEQPKKNSEDPTILGSVSYVPSACGLVLASKAVNYLIDERWG